MDSTDDDEELGASPMVNGWAPPATTFPTRELAKHAAEFESAHNEVWRAMGFLVAEDEPLPLMDKTTKRRAAEQLRKLARRNKKGSREVAEAKNDTQFQRAEKRARAHPVEDRFPRHRLALRARG